MTEKVKRSLSNKLKIKRKNKRCRWGESKKRKPPGKGGRSYYVAVVSNMIYGPKISNIEKSYQLFTPNFWAKLTEKNEFELKSLIIKW